MKLSVHFPPYPVKYSAKPQVNGNGVWEKNFIDSMRKKGSNSAADALSESLLLFKEGRMKDSMNACTNALKNIKGFSSEEKAVFMMLKGTSLALLGTHQGAQKSVICNRAASVVLDEAEVRMINDFEKADEAWLNRLYNVKALYQTARYNVGAICVHRPYAAAPAFIDGKYGNEKPFVLMVNLEAFKADVDEFGKNMKSYSFEAKGDGGLYLSTITKRPKLFCVPSIIPKYKLSMAGDANAAKLVAQAASANFLQMYSHAINACNAALEELVVSLPLHVRAHIIKGNAYAGNRDPRAIREYNEAMRLLANHSFEFMSGSATIENAVGLAEAIMLSDATKHNLKIAGKLFDKGGKTKAADTVYSITFDHPGTYIVL